MSPDLLTTALLAFGPGEEQVIAWLEWAFYPSLLFVLAGASLGVPIPEDIPLIAAGVLLNTHPEIASWHLTFIVAFIGIMSGDLVLYSMGRFFGPAVVNHRFVRRIVTPSRFRNIIRMFRKYGIWAVFFGRFFMGIRAMMCLAAGVTRFPYWKFFLADCAGAVLSIPLFVLLGYWFADMLPTLRSYLVGVQGALIIMAVVAAVVILVVVKVRLARRSSAPKSPPIITAQSDSTAA
jgi:membrane protein DedA with SNARE-associated domain